jgi:hypothetical protein
MMIEIPEAPASDNPDTLQQNAVQTQHRASNTTVLITEAQVVALGTAAATDVRRKERRWVALLSRIFVAAARQSRPKRRRSLPRMAYLANALMAREMERL